MKKIIGIIAIFAFSLNLASAQGDFEDVRFGFQMSPSFSWMVANTTRISPSGTNLGLKLGMVGEFYFRENYALTSGLGFAFNSGGTLLHETGGTYWTRSDLPPALDTVTNDAKLKYGIQYLEIPLGLKMRTSEFGYLRYYIEPAITLGIKTQARGEITDRNTSTQDEKINIRQEVNGINISWGVGAGVEYALSEDMSLVGGLAFQAGFIDATDDNGTVFDQRGNRRESSKGTVNNIVIKIALMF